MSNASWSGLASNRSRTNFGSSSAPTDKGGARPGLVVVAVAAAAPKLNDCRGSDDEEVVVDVGGTVGNIGGWLCCDEDEGEILWEAGRPGESVVGTRGRTAAALRMGGSVYQTMMNDQERPPVVRQQESENKTNSTE